MNNRSAKQNKVRLKLSYSVLHTVIKGITHNLLTLCHAERADEYFIKVVRYDNYNQTEYNMHFLFKSGCLYSSFIGGLFITFIHSMAAKG